jgi:hypothetical protein
LSAKEELITGAVTSVSDTVCVATRGSVKYGFENIGVRA